MLSTVRNLVEETAKSAIDVAYHKSHGYRARKILRQLEQVLGKVPERERRRCDEYAIAVFGHRDFAPWLHVYTALARTFKEGWIPDNFYGAAVVPALKGLYGKVSSLKPLNRAIFRSDLFPDIGAYVNGIFLDTDYQPIAPARFKDLLFRDSEKVAFKVDNSLQGRGIVFFTRDSFDEQHVRRLGNGVFQSFIRQHHLFNGFSPSAVATLRITTTVDDSGEVTVRSSYLRFGTGNDTHVQSKSHVRVPIDTTSGRFAEQGYMPDWLPTPVHPNSQKPFAGNVVPSFADCVDAVRSLHAKVPFARCVGWDVAVDSEGNVRIMEWNAFHNDIKFSEATQGPCFRDLGWENLRLQHVPRY